MFRVSREEGTTVLVSFQDYGRRLLVYGNVLA